MHPESWTWKQRRRDPLTKQVVTLFTHGFHLFRALLQQTASDIEVKILSICPGGALWERAELASTGAYVWSSTTKENQNKSFFFISCHISFRSLLCSMQKSLGLSTSSGKEMWRLYHKITEGQTEEQEDRGRFSWRRGRHVCSECCWKNASGIVSRQQWAHVCQDPLPFLPFNRVSRAAQLRQGELNGRLYLLYSVSIFWGAL